VPLVGSLLEIAFEVAIFSSLYVHLNRKVRFAELLIFASLVSRF
jgi:hypothetical protein